MGSALNRFNAFQQRHRALAIPFAVIKKSSDDSGGNLAALLAFYGLFSLFPLLLVFATILGYVLAGDPHRQHSVEHSIRNQFPAVGKDLPLTGIHGSVIALVIGVATSLWAGLGVTNAAQNLMNTVWAVPHKDRPDFLQTRIRGVGLLLGLGSIFVLSTLITGAIATAGGPGAKVGGYVASVIVNFVLFGLGFRLMTDDDVKNRELRTGAAVGAVLWTLVQAGSTQYIAHVNTGSYGSFSTIILLIIFLHLGAQVFMYSAEINTVVTRKLWPRSLFGPPTAVDQEARTALAKIEERSKEQQVDVAFHESPDD